MPDGTCICETVSADIVGPKENRRTIRIFCEICDNEGRAGWFARCCRHPDAFVSQILPDHILDNPLEDSIIEPTLIISKRNDLLEHVVDLENLSRQGCVSCYTFLDGLNGEHLEFGYLGTIPSLPNMMAINPPVLVPPIRSKHSQGFGTVVARVSNLISCIMSRKIIREARPRIPPPSKVRTRI